MAADKGAGPGGTGTTLRPRTVEEAIARVRSAKASPDEVAELDGGPPAGDALEGEQEPGEGDGGATDADQLEDLVEEKDVARAMRGEDGRVSEERSKLPAWAVLPPDFNPPPGVSIMFVKLRAEWTQAPEKGDRILVLWDITVGDEKLAHARARGEAWRTVPELAKQMVRYVDQQRTDFSGLSSAQVTRRGLGTYPVEELWQEIGYKCRSLLQGLFLKTHQLSNAEKVDFFTNCLAVRTAVRSSTTRRG